MKVFTVILLLFTSTLAFSAYELCLGYYGLFWGVGITYFNDGFYISGRLSGFELSFVNWFFPQLSAGYSFQTPKLGPLETSVRGGGFLGITLGVSTWTVGAESPLFGLEAFATFKLPVGFGKIGMLAGTLFPIAGFTSSGAIVFYPGASPVMFLPQFGITYDF